MQRGVNPRDAVVLLPFAALLVPAREAFAVDGGWLPRIETPLTLAATLAAPPLPMPGQLGGDTVLDTLNAAALLRRQPWGRAHEQRDRRGFAHVVSLFVDAAQTLRGAALLQPPAARPAFWARARAQAPAAGGPGAFEGALLQAALAWAEQGAPAATDALFDCRPGAWVVLRLGGSDELAQAAALHSGAPVLLLDADADTTPPGGSVERWVCDAAEEEAWAAATQVLDALNAGRTPVALVALDRTLVRRVRALLERQQVPLIDETGWTLSTTRAAARLMALLRAAAPGAGHDTVLAWLKDWPPALAQADGVTALNALNALEARWRDPRRRADAGAAALLADALAHLQPFTLRRERTLAGWLELLYDSLAADGSLARLQDDSAGEQLLQALRLRSSDGAWRAAAEGLQLDLGGFTAWVENTLEAAQFVPPPQPGAEVVLTPLARAIGRPFAHVVVPGADQAHLGAVNVSPSLIGPALAEALGLDSATSRHLRQRLAFAQLLRVPMLSLLRRRLDDDEPLAPSPEVEALVLRRLQAGVALAPERRWQSALQSVEPTPLWRPAPSAPHDLPAALSASAVEALRACPYRFFSRAVLRLSERDELEAGLEKRDYGTWLHAVLHRFHQTRDDSEAAPAALMRAADDVTVEQGLDAAELLPYRASFELFAPAYLRWLAAREAQGWRWQAGETSLSAEPAAWAPQTLRGVLDRLDRGADGSLQLIDYKTGSVQGLKARVADALEDTQLAFYAALEPEARSALYLALDDAKAPLAIEHPDVGHSAAVLVEEIGRELQRLRDGAGLPALGEGAVCETCEARGLCRRDHWSAP